jgi:hypothetical protein
MDRTDESSPTRKREAGWLGWLRNAVKHEPCGQRGGHVEREKEFLHPNALYGRKWGGKKKKLFSSLCVSSLTCDLDRRRQCQHTRESHHVRTPLRKAKEISSLLRGRV